MTFLRHSVLPVAAVAAFSIWAASADAAAPFSQMPDDANMIARLDVDAMMKTPRLASIAGAVPAIEQYVLGALKEQFDSAVLEELPGELRVFEFGARNPRPQSESLEYFLAYGDMDSDAVQDLVASRETGGLQFALAGDSGIAASESAEDLALLTSAETVGVGAGSLGGLIGKQGGNPLFFAVRLNDETRADLKLSAEGMRQQAMMVPGLPALLGEAGSLDTVAMSLSEGESVNLNLHLSFLDDEIATRATAALNQIVPGAAELVKMSAQTEDVVRMAEEMGALRFIQDGAAASLSVPIPDEMVRGIASQIESAHITTEIRRTALLAGENGVIPAGKRMPFPAISTATFDGEDFALTGLKGSVVVVDFWATWCGPCVKELPNLIQLDDDYEERGVEIVSISLDRKREDLSKFMATREMDWTHIFDEKGELATRLGIMSIPTVFVVDQAGRIAASDVRGSRLETAVAAVLAEVK